MKRTSSAPAVTSLPQAPRDEALARSHRYMITMAVRMVCFILMVTVTPYDWYTWVFGVGAAVLPYIAVVFANAVRPTPSAPVETPVVELMSPRPAVSEPPRVITVHERDAEAGR